MADNTVMLIKGGAVFIYTNYAWSKTKSTNHNMIKSCYCIIAAFDLVAKMNTSRQVYDKGDEV